MPIPLLGTGLTFVGVLLVILAVDTISRDLGNRRILFNYVYSIAFALLGVLLAGMLVSAALAQIPFLDLIFRPLFRFPEITTNLALNVVLALVLALMVLWAFYVLSAIFLKRSFDSIASGLGAGLFSTAALIYLIGAILVGVLVGLLVILVAQVIQTVAFFSMPAASPATSRPTSFP